MELVLRIKPLERVIASEDCPVHSVAVLFDDLFGMYTMQIVLALVCAAAICTVPR